MKTKKQRLEIYKKMLKCYDEYKYVFGFCSVLRLVMSNRLINLDKYPELMKYKPKRKKAYWFPLDKDGINRRKEILRKIIKEMEA